MDYKDSQKAIDCQKGQASNRNRGSSQAGRKQNQHQGHCPDHRQITGNNKAMAQEGVTNPKNRARQPTPKSARHKQAYTGRCAPRSPSPEGTPRPARAGCPAPVNPPTGAVPLLLVANGRGGLASFGAYARGCRGGRYAVKVTERVTCHSNSGKPLRSNSNGIKRQVTIINPPTQI